MNRPSAEAIDALFAALSERLAPGQLSRDEDQLDLYGRDESDTGVFPSQLIAFAEKTEDVSFVLRTAQALGVPVTPVAARSGKSGGSLPLYGGVSLSLERMNRILSISTENLTAICQPGVVTGDFMRAVESQRLFYPPDPNSWEFCSLGGNVAENAGGPRALKYGVTRDYVIGLEWVMPTGEVMRVGRQTIKGVAGYDLVGLFVGSEGTLGVATEITFQLIPLPQHIQTSLILFKDVVSAANAVSAVLAAGILPRTLELLDDVAVGAVDGKAFNFPPGTGAAVLAEVDGNDEEPLFAELARLGEICTEAGATETLHASDGAQRERLWAARRSLSTALRALKRYKISEDIAVPRARIAEIIGSLKAMGQEMGLTVATYGHAGDGNLHANILYETPEERPKVELAIRRMLELTIAAGGTITGEHGVGFAKREYLSLEQSSEVIALQKKLKALFDPKNLLNPGKIFPL